jgi:hypothetical protein
VETTAATENTENITSGSRYIFANFHAFCVSRILVVLGHQISVPGNGDHDALGKQGHNITAVANPA